MIYLSLALFIVAAICLIVSFCSNSYFKEPFLGSKIYKHPFFYVTYKSLFALGIVMLGVGIVFIILNSFVL